MYVSYNLTFCSIVVCFFCLDEHEEYQLVSWSKDQTLRLWKASKKTIQVQDTVCFSFFI